MRLLLNKSQEDVVVTIAFQLKRMPCDENQRELWIGKRVRVVARRELKDMAHNFWRVIRHTTIEKGK